MSKELKQSIAIVLIGMSVLISMILIVLQDEEINLENVRTKSYLIRGCRRVTSSVLQIMGDKQIYVKIPLSQLKWVTWDDMDIHITYKDGRTEKYSANDVILTDESKKSEIE